jgi:hypothetical protein
MVPIDEAACSVAAGGLVEAIAIDGLASGVRINPRMAKTGSRQRMTDASFTPDAIS